MIPSSKTILIAECPSCSELLQKGPGRGFALSRAPLDVRRHFGHEDVVGLRAVAPKADEWTDVAHLLERWEEWR